MALTGMQIYKSLPRTNCGDCKLPTCMAFAMQVAAKQKALTDCPHLSDKAKSELGDASAPPMKLVKIGAPGETCVELGQETVMFRHEEKFHKQPALAAKVAASLSDSDALARIEQINKATFTRVGQQIGVRLAAVEVEGLAPEKARDRVKALSDKSRVPFVVIGSDAGAVGAAVAAIAGKKPLVYKATPENADAFIKIAADNKCPLAVGADTLEQMADLTQRAQGKGVQDIVLAFDGRKCADAVRKMTIARRSALKKTFRPLGFPSMADASADDAMRETVLAASCVAKYAAIVLVNGLDGAELLPVLTVAQNIYTDPQVPNEVEAKLYEIGNVGDNSPVMFTTNFSLTYFSVAAEVERSKIPAYILVIDTEGLGVLNSYAGDKLAPETVVKALEASGVSEKVKHRKLIIPGLLPSFRAEIEETSEWKEVQIGPENASGISAFLSANWK